MSDSPTSPLVLKVACDAPAIHTVTLHGDLDHDTGDLLVGTVRSVLQSRRAVEVRLDCAGLDVIDSSGLSALLMTLRQCDAAGARLRLANQSDALRRLLSVTGTAPLFDTHTEPPPRPTRPAAQRDVSVSALRERQ